jgi:DNA gyrase subunit A
VQTPFPHTAYCCNRCAVVRKRATRDLQRAQARLHLVQGFLLAMNDLDKVLPLPHAADPSCLHTTTGVRTQLPGSHRASSLICSVMAMKPGLAQVVATIRAADDGASAASQLRSLYGMSGEQAEGVLNLSLRRLTSLEARKLQEESDTLTARYSLTSPLADSCPCS